MVNADNIHALMMGILETDPIPFDRINVNGPNAYQLIFNSIWEQYQTQWKSLDRVATEEMMLAIIIKLVCENFYLHTKLLMLGEADK